MKKTLFVIMLMAVAIVFTGCPKAKKAEPKEKVKLSFHVMSKCPYGAQVVKGVKPALDTLGNAVDFEINYIGNQKGDKWLPMHGEKELQGDKIAVCTKKLYPEKYMDLVFCMAESFRKIPENFEECATKVKFDAAKIKKCSDGDEGQKLVVESYKFSQAQKATGSPTIFLNGEKYKGGRTGSAFTKSLCDTFKTTKPQACNSIPEDPKVKLTLLTDKRCEECNPQRLTQSLKRIFPGVESEVIEYSDPVGKKLYDELAAQGHKLLPFAIFDKSIEKVDGYDKIKRFVKPAGDKVLLRVGAKFDPTKEICDNKKDDTGNGKVDCDDTDCQGQLICRKEVKNTVDLFVMSQCPYGTMALDALKEVKEAFKGDKLDININYIANETEPGKFRSLHGQPEVDENIRELCAIKHFPNDSMEYIWCRNKNIRSAEWKPCAKGKIKANVIEKCSTGPEGIKLFTDNIKIANELGIGASPTWIINNNQKASGVSAKDIQTNICKYNPDLKGCKTTIATPPTGKPQPKGQCN